MKERIDPSRPLGDEIRRLGGTFIAGAIADLEAARDTPEASYHRCRRKLKRLRALIRLLRPADPGFWRAENARWRDLGRSLAGAREAAALVETVDRLVRDDPVRTAGGALDDLRRRLVERHDTMAASMAEGGAGLATALAAAREGQAAFAGCALPDDTRAASRLLAKGSADTLRRAAAACRIARRTGKAEAFHELRKAVKAHQAQLDLLRDLWPKRVRLRLQDLDVLGERLGELNDAEVMRLRLAEGAIAASENESELLDKLLRRTEKRLRRDSLAAAERLFDLKPGRLSRDLVRRYRDRAEANTQ
jgi:CHAD domain-containing protein